MLFPHKAKRQLTRIVLLQMKVLSWAATADALTEESCKAQMVWPGLTQESSAAIARWVLKPGARRDSLEEFAAGPLDAKRRWATELKQDVMNLYFHPTGQLSKFVSATAPQWKRNGADWLNSFYESWRAGDMPSGCFFPLPKLTAAEFLEKFVALNKGVSICPVCEESSYSTMRASGPVAEIDHFFPKANYPHLCCHPFNLFPICHFCNAVIKHMRDPLGDAQHRISIEESWLPYRSSGLTAQTTVGVSIRLGGSIADFERLVPNSGDDVEAKIEILKRVFEVPERWTNNHDAIGQILIRRVKALRRVLATNDLTTVLNHLSLEFKSGLGSERYGFALLGWTNALGAFIHSQGTDTSAYRILLEQTSALE